MSKKFKSLIDQIVLTLYLFKGIDHRRLEASTEIVAVITFVAVVVLAFAWVVSPITMPEALPKGQCQVGVHCRFR